MYLKVFIYVYGQLSTKRIYIILYTMTADWEIFSA